MNGDRQYRGRKGVTVTPREIDSNISKGMKGIRDIMDHDIRGLHFTVENN